MMSSLDANDLTMSLLDTFRVKLSYHQVSATEDDYRKLKSCLEEILAEKINDKNVQGNDYAKPPLAN